MDPPYQRHGRLWSAADRAYLIDSILNGFDIPKIYMADFTWGDSKLNKERRPYAIIDGKQRFEAIFDFFDGKLVLNKDFVFVPNPALKLGGLSYKDLLQNHAQVAEIFDNYNPLVMGVYAETEEPINELFVRLNRSKPLTGAEIRNAMGGPVPQIIRQLAALEFFTTTVAFSIKRRQDLNAAAKVLMFEYHGEPRETKRATLDQFVRTAGKAPGRAKLDLAARQVVDVLGDMNRVFLPRDSLLGSAGIVPVYYWLVRSLSAEEQTRLREFLVSFEDDRRENRGLSPSSPNVDRELVEYGNYNRSTNDQASHVGRHRILLKRFQARSTKPQ